MNNLPFHPLIVHFPLALAILVPFVALGCLVLSWRRAGRVRLWRFVSIVLAAVVLSGIVAMKTGEVEEEKVEPFVGESWIEIHEERAELFVWGAAVALGLTLAVPPLAGKPRWRRALGLATVLATVVAAGLAVRVGHSGGELVYVRGAALAYTGSLPDPMDPRKPLPGQSESSTDEDPRTRADSLRAELTLAPVEP